MDSKKIEFDISSSMTTDQEYDMIELKVNNSIRPGCKDIWNAFMVEGAYFGKYDIPFCPTTATDVPQKMVTWNEAKELHRKHISRKEYDYKENAFVNWYLDDYKFDRPSGIWHKYNYVLTVLRHFAGAITPDFGTNQDFPAAVKIYATYRMRAYGYWLGKEGIKIINNVRWGTAETYSYCFEGIPKNSIISIGTVGGSPRKIIDRHRFENGLYRMVEILKPHTILIYGSDKGKCFDILRKQGITIVSFQSRTAKVYEGRKQHE